MKHLLHDTLDEVVDEYVDSYEAAQADAALQIWRSMQCWEGQPDYIFNPYMILNKKEMFV